MRIEKSTLPPRKTQADVSLGPKKKASMPPNEAMPIHVSFSAFARKVRLRQYVMATASAAPSSNSLARVSVP